jgi:hypothetical protein
MCAWKERKWYHEIKIADVLIVIVLLFTMILLTKGCCDETFYTSDDVYVPADY